MPPHSNPLDMIKKMGNLYKQSLEMVVKNNTTATTKNIYQYENAVNNDRKRRVQRYLDKKRMRLEKKKVLLR